MDEQLANREGAIEAYRKILSIDPEDPGALRLLGRLLGVAERWEELAAVMEREAEAAARRPDAAAEAAELRYRLGRIRQVRLADAPGALAAYRQVLERAPRHPGTLGGAAGARPDQRSGRPRGRPAAGADLRRRERARRVIEVLEARVQNEAAPSARSGAAAPHLDALRHPAPQRRAGLHRRRRAPSPPIPTRSRRSSWRSASASRSAAATRSRSCCPRTSTAPTSRPPASSTSGSWPGWSRTRPAPPRPGSGCWSWRRRTARRAPACWPALRGGPDAEALDEGAAACPGAGGAARGPGGPAGRPGGAAGGAARRSGRRRGHAEAAAGAGPGQPRGHGPARPAARGRRAVGGAGRPAGPRAGRGAPGRATRRRCWCSASGWAS